MDPNLVTIPLALLAGLLSFISPCVMPLIPAYIGYLGGTTFSAAGTGGSTISVVDRRTTFFHAAAFVLGFSIVFVLLGASVGLVGLALYNYLPTIQKIGGVIIVIFGLHTMGIIRIPFHFQERRMEMKSNRRLGYLSSTMMGVIFSAGWVPCVGPILTSILLLAGNSQTIGQGAVLLGVYSIGLGIPFLLAGAAFSSMSQWLRKMNRFLPIISFISGLFLIIVGVLLFTDSFRFLSAYGSFIETPLL